tara:strand:- start:1747 stop:2805 length:1059 start_codon:yes stop_codon:yes gene_type:complete
MLPSWGVIAAEERNALPEGRMAIAGYGDVTYESSDRLNTSAFTANFTPIFLFRLNDRLHVEAETEFALNDVGSTEVELEYIDIHYFLNDTSTITAGKFLLPFGQFSQNIHPSWINRSPWTPGIYGSHGGTQAMTALLPVLSDVGVSFQKIFPFNSRQKIFVDVFLTNGARAEEAGHEEVGEVEEVLPEVEFEATNGDNNKDKAFGGRLAYAFLPGLEVGASYYQASYDDAGSLEVKARGLDVNFIHNHMIIRGEYIATETDGFEDDVIHNFKRDGWYLQGIYHLGRLFQIFDSTDFVIERAEVNKLEESSRWVYGFNYWLDDRSLIKIAYEDTKVTNGDDDKRFAIQFSYGF